MRAYNLLSDTDYLDGQKEPRHNPIQYGLACQLWGSYGRVVVWQSLADVVVPPWER